MTTQGFGVPCIDVYTISTEVRNNVHLTFDGLNVTVFPGKSMNDHSGIIDHKAMLRLSFVLAPEFD